MSRRWLFFPTQEEGVEPFKEGFNFRTTEEFVEDPADSQFVSADTSYPTTSGGVTFGWTTAPTDDVNRSTDPDPRLSGINYRDNTGIAKFRVDLPASGNYSFRLALGDYGSDQGCRLRVVDSDDETVLLDIGDVNVTGANFLDATDVSRTAAAWPDDNLPETVEFTGTSAFFWLGASSVGLNSTIAHLELERQ